MSPGQNDFGIEITAPAQCKKKDGLIVQGTYRVKYPAIGIPEIPTQIAKHIVLVMYSPIYMACKPFYDVVVFDDDVKNSDKSCIGQFNLNVFDHVPYNESGEYIILCSLGTHLSGLLKVTVL